MSLYDDYYADIQFAMNVHHDVNNDEWRTREGKVLKVKDMSTAHIKNCMRRCIQSLQRKELIIGGTMK